MSTSTVMTQAVARLLLAPILLVAVAVLVKGYTGVGDGFSAGVIAALGFALQLFAFGRDEAGGLLPRRRAYAAAATGLALALAIAFLPILFGRPVLTHVPGADTKVVKLGSLELISAFAYDVALALLVFGVVVGILDAWAGAAQEERR